MKLDSLGGTDISKAEDQFKRERENKGNIKQDKAVVKGQNQRNSRGYSFREEDHDVYVCVCTKSRTLGSDK